MKANAPDSFEARAEPCNANTSRNSPTRSDGAVLQRGRVSTPTVEGVSGALCIRVLNSGDRDELEVSQINLELAKGKSPEMKAMATQIIAAQNKEIAEFDRWLSQQK